MTTFTVIIGYIYAFFDPGVLNPDGTLAGTTIWGLVYAAGLFLVSMVVIAAMVAVYRGAKVPLSPPVIASQASASPKSEVVAKKQKFSERTSAS